jgi:putative phosphoribosyl transferase
MAEADVTPDAKHQPYTDRRHAGMDLAAHLQPMRGRSDVVVIALPRAGVLVAYEVATALSLPLDVLLVRKLGVPEHPELAMGAIATRGVVVLDDDVVSSYSVPGDAIDRLARREQVELEMRGRTYREGRPSLELRHRVVVLVDDGLSTLSTMRAAIQAVRAHRPSRVVVAMPVAASEICRELLDVADEVVRAREPERFAAAGAWYTDFSQTASDRDVRDLLRSAAGNAVSASQ